MAGRAVQTWGCYCYLECFTHVLQSSNFELRTCVVCGFPSFPVVQDLLKANGRREVSANQRSQSLTPVTMLIAKTCQNQFHNFMPKPSVACALVMRVMDQKTNLPCNRTVRKVRKHQEVSSSLAAHAVCQRQCSKKTRTLIKSVSAWCWSYTIIPYVCWCLLCVCAFWDVVSL